MFLRNDYFIGLTPESGPEILKLLKLSVFQNQLKVNKNVFQMSDQ